MKYIFQIHSILIVFILAISQSYAENLLQIYELAKKNDINYQIAKYNFYLACDNKNIIFSQFFPSIKFQWEKNYNSNYINFTKKINEKKFSILIDQIIFDYSILESYQQSKIGSYIAFLEYKKILQDLLVKVVNIYFDILQKKDNLYYAEMNEKNIYKNMLKIKYQYKVGISNKNDFVFAMENYKKSSMNKKIAENSLKESIENLKAITGKNIFQLSKLDFISFFKNVINTNHYYINKIHYKNISHNISLQKIQLQKKYDKYGIQIEKGNFLPKIHFLGNYTKINTANLQNNRINNEFTGSIVLDYNIISGGKNYYDMQRAYFLYKKDFLNIIKMRRDLMQQIQFIYTEINSDIFQIKSLRKILKFNRFLLKNIKIKFEKGMSNIQDILNAENDFFESKKQYSNNIYKYIMDIFSLKKISGNLSYRDLLYINRYLSKEIKII